MCVVMLIGVIVFVTSRGGGTANETMAFINILFLFVFIRRLREVWGQIFNVIMGSIAVFIIIYTFLLFFSFLGYALFATNENDASFDDPVAALYTLLVLFTVSNYPNIAIPYFAHNRIAAVYFWVFLCVGVFLLTNLLLAVIFNNY